MAKSRIPRRNNCPIDGRSFMALRAGLEAAANRLDRLREHVLKPGIGEPPEGLEAARGGHVMGARGQLRPLKLDVSTPHELGRIQAAMWLIDQMQRGDLSFLTFTPPDFGATAAFLTISPEQLADNLRRMVCREVGDALHDADTAFRDVARQLEGLDGGRA
jgi:hypothetical protein